MSAADSDYSARACPLCGGKEFEWGSLGDTRFYRGTSEQGVFGGTVQRTHRLPVLKARRCTTCDRVDIFVPEK